MEQQDPMPPASAPEPSADPAPDVATDPVLAADESGHAQVSADVPRRRGRRRSIAFVAAIVAFDLIVAVGVGLYLSATAPTGALDLPPGVEYGLRARVAASYPGYIVAGVQKTALEGTATASGGREVGVFFELQSVSHPGFVLSRLYTAPEQRAGDAKNYSNSDDFFLTEATQDQPVGSFIEMWVHERPGQTVYFVSEGGYSTDATRTYLVMAEWSERNGTAIKTVRGSYDYEYSTTTDTWAGKTAAEPSSASFTPAASYTPYALADTATVVAEALPGFVAYGTTGDASNETMLLVKHVKYPGLQMAVYPLMLDPPDPIEDMVQLFRGDRVKADAFAKAWSARHSGTIIDFLWLDPDDTGDLDTVDVTYVESVAGVDDAGRESSVVFHYDAKKHTWKPVK